MNTTLRISVLKHLAEIGKRTDSRKLAEKMNVDETDICEAIKGITGKTPNFCIIGHKSGMSSAPPIYDFLLITDKGLKFLNARQRD